MTHFGRTFGSRPVFFAPPSEMPQMVVISEPEYVVGTATTGSAELSAIALPKPMVEPPPTAMQQSASTDFAIARAAPTAATRAHHACPAGRGDQQRAPRAEPLDFRGKLADAVGAEHHAHRHGNIGELVHGSRRIIVPELALIVGAGSGLSASLARKCAAAGMR